MGYANGIYWTYNSVNEYLLNLGYFLISKEYKNVRTKLVFKDLDNYWYYMSLDVILRGNTPKKFYKTNPYVIQNIILWCKLNNKSFELISDKFEGVFSKLKWKCLNENCKEEFEAIWHDTLDNCGCPYCCNPAKKVGLSNCLATKNPKLASEWHPTLNGDLTPYDVTCGSNEYIWWQCKNNSEHEWQSFVSARDAYDSGCPYCAGQRATKEYNLLISNSELCEEWNYKRNDKFPQDYTPKSGQKVWWICEECGWEWPATIANRSNGRGCPKCAESKGEKQLDLILTKYNISHNNQYSFDDLIGVGNGLLRFDTSIFWDIKQTQLRMLIEYDGIFHYEKQYNDDGFETLRIHDKLKNEYCRIHNIKLLRIPYWEFDNIEEILLRELNLNNNIKAGDLSA